MENVLAPLDPLHTHVLLSLGRVTQNGSFGKMANNFPHMLTWAINIPFSPPLAQGISPERGRAVKKRRAKSDDT